MNRPAQASLARLGEIVGEAHVLTEPSALAAHAIGSLRPSAVAMPAETAEIREVIRFAAAENHALTPCGGCTKLAIGDAPDRYDFALDLSRMNRVLAYDPQDLTLGVEPGVRVVELLRVLGEQKQFLPLSVPFAERATVGGVVAANPSSPLRHAYGGMRDFCLGMEFVTGEGVVSKSGGRVVKNVTGYDLHKLLIGSLGTLAVITRINLRTFPILPVRRTFLAVFSGPGPAFAFSRSLDESPLAPQAVEVFDPGAARLAGESVASSKFDPQSWFVAVTAAGKPSVVDRYARDLTKMASATHTSGFDSLTDFEQESVLDSARDFSRLVLDAAPSALIFRIGILPSAMPVLYSGLRKVAVQNDLDLASIARASGVLFAALSPKQTETTLALLEKTAKEIFELFSNSEIATSAMLEWAPEEVKRATWIWGPPRKNLELMRRIKAVFDPSGILSPGRLGGEI